MTTTNSHRVGLMRHLGAEIRAGQRATDVVDDLVTEIMGINRTDSRCLDIIEQHGRVSAGELAVASGLTTGAVTAVVDRLERIGYAHRVADPADRRRVLVELTPKARELIWELMGGPMREAAVPLMSRYSDEQLQLLIDFQRQNRETQERHAEWLRRRLAGSGPTARERTRPVTRT